MNKEERLLALDSFSKYYKTAELNVPEREKREIGIGFEEKIAARHMAFETKEQLRNYLINNTPFFISYSTAYYENPSNTPIEKKGWLGADLVFDLDTHGEGKYSAFNKLGQVKQDTIRLAEEFLENDFGLSKTEIFYVFSGNRGYHIHVRSKDVFSLGIQERREIVDYVRGNGLDFRLFFYEEERNRNRIIGPKVGDTGYKGRFVAKVLEVMKDSPSQIYRGFSDQGKKNNFINGIKEGNWSRIPFSLEKLQEKLSFVAASLPLLSVDADAGVTHDIKKLIRMPNTIHGETGFIAKEIRNINSFEPMREALPDYKTTAKVKFLEKTPELVLGDSTYSFEKEQELELPLSVALFFILKGSAMLVIET